MDKNVRNVSELLLDFESYEHGYIYGGNNQGKTTVLEAIYLAAKQNSPIQNDIKKIITEHQQECVVGLDLVHDTRKRLYARFFYDGKKDIRLNEKKEERKERSKRGINYISADALHLFQKDPEYRRKHLDRFCSSYFPDYLQNLKVYNATLKQKQSVKAANT